MVVGIRDTTGQVHRFEFHPEDPISHEEAMKIARSRLFSYYQRTAKTVLACIPGGKNAR